MSGIKIHFWRGNNMEFITVEQFQETTKGSTESIFRLVETKQW